MRLRDHDELTHGRDTVDKDVYNIWASWGNVPVRRHCDGDGLAGAAGLVASVVQESHAVAHVNGVGNESTIVEGNLDSLVVGRCVELDGELGAISLQVLAGKHDVGRTGRVALEIGRSVDLVTELSDEWVLGVRCEDRLLDRVGARDEKGTVEKEESDTVVQASNVGLGSGGPALALGLVGVVEEDLKSWILGNTKTLSTFLSTIDPNAGTIGEKSTFNHTTTFGHRVHLPLRVGVKRPDATARWVTGSGDVLVRAATTDDDIGVPVVGAGQGHHDGASSVGISAVGTGEVSELANSLASTNVEDLSRLGYLNEQVTVLHQVHEWVHVIRLVLAQDLHVEARALGRTIGVQDLVSRVVVLRLARVETVQATRCDKDLVVGHDLNGRVPAGSVKLCTRLIPRLTIELAVGGSLQETDALEAVTNGGVDEVQRSVATERSEATISKEDTSRAESVGLVGKGSQLLGDWVVLGRVGVLAVAKLELGVVLNLVQEDNLTVGHETSVHGGDTRPTLLDEGTGLLSSRSGASCRGRLAGCFVAGAVLTSLATMGCSVTTVSVHATARTLSPVAADSTAKLGTAAAVDSGNASWLCAYHARGLTENGLTRGAHGRWTGVGGYRSGS
jgi:hypothetical protein